MRLNIKISVTVLFLLFSATILCQKKVDNTPKPDSAKKLTAYEKIFEKKSNVKSVKGLITLHNISGKLYIELPLNLLKKSFLMSSVVDNSSNPSLSYQGQRASRPIEVSFSRTDSLVQINIIPAPVITSKEDSGIASAVAMSSMPKIIHSCPIAAINPDSTAILFDATSFFVSGSKYIGVLNSSGFGGFIQKVSNFSKDLSSLKDVESYSDNIAVISNMTYTFNTYFLGMESGGVEYLTVELRTTLKLLQDNNFRYRFADYRIGTANTEFERFSSSEQKSSFNYFANRWRLEPSNVADYSAGKLSEPVKPIVFYVDTLFTPVRREAVKRGILKWNKVFEKAGFKNVITVKDYPSKKENPLFSAADNSFSCVKYALTPSRNISRQINTDPRTGEILSANILFYTDSPVTLQRERIYQTASVEPEVRDYKLSENLLCHSIELAMTREAGLCLGLTPNLAASAWIPTDSLRSASFTSKEGITSSVTDFVRYNYVAQPGDREKGVKLFADEPGVYDYYAIDWLYRVLPQFNTPFDEKDYLSKLISSKAGDKRFYYGREQNGSANFDPRAVAEDLGDDKLKSTLYGINTLKFVSTNAANWVNKDEVDESYRELFADFIFLKLYDYFKAVMVNIGGMEINNNFEGDKNPSFKPLSKELQKRSLMFILEQSDNLKWLDNKELLKMSGMNGTFSEYYANNLAKLVFYRIPMVAFTASKSENPYSVDEVLSDIREFAMKNLLKGEEISDAQKSILVTLTQSLLSESNLPEVNSAKAKSKSAFTLEADAQAGSALDAGIAGFNASLDPFMAENAGFNASLDPFMAENAGFEPLIGVKYLVKDDLSALYYKHLLELRKELKKAKSKSRSEASSNFIGYLLLAVDKGIGGK